MDIHTFFIVLRGYPGSNWPQNYRCEPLWKVEAKDKRGLKMVEPCWTNEDQAIQDAIWQRQKSRPVIGLKLSLAGLGPFPLGGHLAVPHICFSTWPHKPLRCHWWQTLQLFCLLGTFTAQQISKSQVYVRIQQVQDVSKCCETLINKHEIPPPQRHCPCLVSSSFSCQVGSSIGPWHQALGSISRRHKETTARLSGQVQPSNLNIIIT